MATKAFQFERRSGTRADVGFGMRVYWAVVIVASLALLGMTVHVATPRDAAEMAEASIGR
jgi:D-arabinose 5-phosphate isomerase GutQ